MKMTNYETITDLANRAEVNFGDRSAAGAVYIAALFALDNYSEEEINEWDLLDNESCGINRIFSVDGKISWDAHIGENTGDDYTRCTLYNALNAETWYLEEWTHEM